MLHPLVNWYWTRREHAELRRLADTVNSAMRFVLSLYGRYRNGISECVYWEGTPKDYAEGAMWVRRAAEYAGLDFLAGAMSVEEEFKRGLRKAAEKGSVDAQVILGDICLCKAFGNNQWRLLRKGSRYTEALMWFGVAALQGDAEAQLRLGLMYAEGKGVLKKNKVEAAQWYGKAAEQGHTMAQTVLAGAYEDGLGVQRDYVRAAKWYQEAAEQGAGHAQYKLGCMYAEGKGVLTNEVEAVKWYRIAAGQDNAWAQRALGHAYEYGLGVPQGPCSSGGVVSEGR